MNYEIKQLQRLPGDTPLTMILRDRGIKDVEHYLNVTDDDILDPRLLDNIQQGAEMLINHISNRDKTYIQIDSDCDGYTSAAILLNYLHLLYPDYVEECVTYGLHDGKQHGLDVDKLPEDVRFVIIPDAGSNELDIHAELKKKGIDILILDHHLADKITQDAVLINNQTCDYPTKSLCGAAVVYKFCSYLDLLLGVDYANNFLDLAALGLIADVMDLRDFETHRIIEKGLENIYSPFIQEMINKNSYSIKGELSPFKVSFYVAPAINAVTRVGTADEKELLFKALLEYEANKEIKSTKRGSAWDDKERLVDQAVRACTNIRNRQNKERDKYFTNILKQVEVEGLNKNKILAIKLNTFEENTKELTGLIANKLMSTFQQPVLLLYRVFNDNGDVCWSGSGRNGSNNGLTDFRAFLQSTNLIELAEGHENAFGFSVKDDNFDALIDYSNKELANYDFTPRYKVDFNFDANNYDIYDIIDIAQHNYLWGEGLEQPLVMISNIGLTADAVERRGTDTLVISLNGLELVKFKASDEDFEKLKTDTSTYKTINVIGTCSINDYNSTPQIIINDFEVAKQGYYF